MEPNNKVTISISKKWLMIIVVIIILCAALAGAYFKINDHINTIKNTELSKGYNQCLIDIASVVATNGFATYIVPTTNITVSLGFNALPK